jgi:hypothetical protein
MNDKFHLIHSLKVYFDVRELACPHLFDKHGDNSWEFFDYQLLSNLFTLRRTVINGPMFINNYAVYGPLSQRGYRCPLCQIVENHNIQLNPYFSAHLLGRAFDFTSQHYTAQVLRQMIIDSHQLLPFHFRLERTVNWVHFDTLCFDSTQPFELFR